MKLIEDARKALRSLEPPVARVLDNETPKRSRAGRPRTDAPRCYCGALTAKLALIQCHHCEPGYAGPDKSRRYKRRAMTELNCFCGAMSAKEAWAIGHKCAPRDIQALTKHQTAQTRLYLTSTLQALRDSRNFSFRDVADQAGGHWREQDARDWEKPEFACASIEVLTRLAVVYGFKFVVEFRLPDAPNTGTIAPSEGAQADEGEESLT